MKTLIKILGYNLAAFVIYSIFIGVISQDDHESFAFVMYFSFFIGLQVAVNLVFTIATGIRKSAKFKYYLCGLGLSICMAVGMYFWLE